jgi:hypothetical protein
VTTRERLLVFCCLLFAGGLFVLGINWGLPSRASDEFLFGGSQKPWTGAEILALAPIEEDPNRGADVDADPLTGRDKVLVLNQTDKQRAEIVRRYRLFTYQPDEYNTLKSLAGMNPGRLQLDPRMYQYGGLWIYPVGALLKLASIVGIIDLRNDKAFYLDHPETFGRFYVIARLYSAAWGVVGAWAVYMLARKLTARSTPAAAASACWAMMPVVVNMGHEAKPHLAGLSIMLLAILAASRYVETGERRWWVLCAIACGAATGMVISSLVIFVLLPMILILRPLEGWRARARLAAKFFGIGLLVYAASNPYVFINLVRNPAVLRSNLGTSTAMYHASAAAGIWLNGGKLMLEAATIAVVLFGVIGVLHVIESSVAQRRLNFYWPGCPAVHLLWLLVVAGLLVAVQFFLLAAGKPGEYGRFALLPATVLCILAVTSFWTFLPPARVAFLSTLLVCTAWFGTNYIAHFDADVDQVMSPRILTADALRTLKRTQAKRLAIVAEPAPYSMPPVDLWHWEVQLLPRGVEPGLAARAAESDVLVRPVDQLPDTVFPGFRRLERPLTQPLLANPARISWAAKPFEILVAERLPVSDVVDSAEPAATEPSQTRPAP